MMKCRKNGPFQGHQMLKRAKRRMFVVFSGLKYSVMSFLVV